MNTNTTNSPLKSSVNFHSRALSNGNLIGSKALTSVFTKKVDLKAQMKVVRRYKEELMMTHEEYIQEIKRFIKELELELKENIGNYKGNYQENQEKKHDLSKRFLLEKQGNLQENTEKEGVFLEKAVFHEKNQEIMEIPKEKIREILEEKPMVFPMVFCEISHRNHRERCYN